MKGLTLVFLATMLAGACVRPRSRCEALDESAERRVVERCQGEYRRGGDAAVGLRVARGLLGLAKHQPSASELLVQAAAIAQELERGEHRAEALEVLADVAQERGDPAAARELFDRQIAYLVASGRSREASRQAHLQAGRHMAAGDTAEAMVASRLAVAQADAAGDARMQVYARLGLANLYRSYDQLADAELELERASDLAHQPLDRSWFAAKQGALLLDRGLDQLAKPRLVRALELAGTDEASAALRLSIHLNLAWIYRRGGDLSSAAAELNRAEELAPQDVDVWLGRGLLAEALGEHGDAVRRLGGAAERAETDSDRWWVWYHLGRLRQQLGDERAALDAYRRSMQSVRALAAAAGPYIGQLAASSRLPFARAAGLAACRGDWRATLELVLELDELALVAAENLREDAASAPEPHVEGRSGGARGSATTVDDFLAAWRGRALIIVLDDRETVWRLEVRDGQVRGAAQGSTAQLEHAARALEADPGALEPARALRAALVPSLWSDVPVYVLTIGPLSRVPLAALERRAAAPLVRVLGLSPRPPRVQSDSRTIVLGDPRGDLPGARAEAKAVAAHLGVTAALGRAVDKGALEAARGAALLHVAAHSTLEADGPALLLADGAVFADALAAMHPAPRVVVLASCGSAAARDDGRWGSLAAAYLAAGAEVVIASAWTLDDGDSHRFVNELYRHPVATDPVRALAATQAALRATLSPRAWSAFTAIAAPPARGEATGLAAAHGRSSLR
jgi:tetratricopeptide (TPR) repeat protein